MPRCMTAFVLALPLLLACDIFSPADTRLLTDAPEYKLTTTPSGSYGNVTLSFTNGNSSSVTIRGCSLWPASLERRRSTDGVWEYASWLGGGAKCLEDFVVRGGATVREVVVLSFPDASFAGEYRVVMDVGEKPEKVTSNTFTLSPSAP